MAWARKSRYLICFYCGTKSQIKYDGTTRQFGCKSCGSTNYLDEVRVTAYFYTAGEGIA